jgi:asparagine synthase (glutamine-hydrolysing)
MCAICGLYVTGSADRGEIVSLAENMALSLFHRGPDGGGTWADPEIPFVFSHRRLAILDLSAAGAQPMESASGRFVIVFNGEIYNLAELRKKVEDRKPGFAWRSRTDTEALLEAVETLGIEPALQSATGMFAFAVLDRSSRNLWLARDRLGEKPLYLYSTEKFLAFASDLDAITVAMKCTPAPDPAAVAEFALRSCISSPRTIYEKVEQLPPASYVKFHLSSQAIRREPTRTYWSLIDVISEAQQLPNLDPGDALPMLEEALTKAVSEQMLADVPLGAFLSGGIDSSLVVALMQSCSQRPIKTYTIGFTDKKHDESAYAEQVAKYIGTDHTTFVLEPRDLWSLLPETIQAYSEPFADSAQIPTYCVARLAREHVTVALTGDGGDELFGGYNRHVFAHRFGYSLFRAPSALRKIAGSAFLALSRPPLDAVLEGANRLLGSQQMRMVALKAAKAGRSLACADVEALYLNLSETGLDASRALSIVDRAFRSSLPSIPGGLDPASRMMCWDTLGYLPNDVLTKVDRATMATSLESRAPFLNHHVVALAWRFPSELKIQGGRGKIALRRLLSRHVPPEIVNRPKAGFGFPVGDWLRDGLRGWAEDLLGGPELREDGFFDSTEVRHLWQAHVDGQQDLAIELWPILMFQAWRRRKPRLRRPVKDAAPVNVKTKAMM